ncbi:MAG TPA: DUF6249 domain-containing protein [Candidatus Babeliales bacterium]|nr:DUF6249 domain-containing protein [Candidatus Babeliales bacterium]
MDSSDFFAFTAVLVIFGAPCAVWLVSRVLAHQERMEMLRRGIVPPPNAREMRRAMKYGWTPGMMQQGAANDYYQTGFAAAQQLRRGMQVAFIGLALLIGLGFIGYRGDGRIDPGPWLLGGLIPLFVGIAQIIGAVLSGATFGVPSARQHFGPTPGPGTTTATGSSGGAMPPGPTYGGWRPGSTPEIEKPASPPDYRS